MTLTKHDGLATLCWTFDPVTIFYIASACAAFAAGYMLWESTPK